MVIPCITRLEIWILNDINQLYTSWVDRPSIDSRVQHQNSYLCVLGCQVLMVTITPGLLFFKFFKKINQKIEARREFGYVTASHLGKL